MPPLSSNKEPKPTVLDGKKDKASLEDLRSMLERLDGMLTEKNLAVEVVRVEIIRIADYIEKTRKEVVTLAGDGDFGQTYGSPAKQLDEVLKSTEAAAHSILDCAEEIQHIALQGNMEKTEKDMLEIIATKIMEACNFQDLTGQRITKVLRALEFTQVRIDRLVGLFDSNGGVIGENLKKAMSGHSDDHLLNGPQLAEFAPSQTDIDAMFK